jgi:hypothetical protein
MSAKLFKEFRDALAVKNSEEISGRYKAITTRLNIDYWNINSDTTHCLQVGSYGRNTAIHGVSDLDMAFELPWEVYARFNKRTGNVQSQLLQEIKQCLAVRYPTTNIWADSQVVVLEFTNYRVEVLPAFKGEDGGYTFPDSNDHGSWKKCWPRDEMTAVTEVNNRANRNLKHVCKMLRSWKNEHGAPMGGMLIDTLAYNFFRGNTSYDTKSYGSYPELMRDVFQYLADQLEQDHWLAPGSKDRVKSKGKFQTKAKKALGWCQEAIDTDTDKKKEKHWRKTFGNVFPTAEPAQKAYARFKNTEEFIEKFFPVDISRELHIDSEVSEKGAVKGNLSRMRKAFNWLPLGHGLKFFIDYCDVPAPCSVYWKIRNVGPLAEQKNQIRGQIVEDEGQYLRTETATFNGPHFVECFIVKDGVCVARDRIDVPLGGEV